MFRASTPTHTFKFGENPEESFSQIQITYAQDGEIVLVKTKDDLTFTNAGTVEEPVYYGILRLTQRETKLFNPRCRRIEVQLRMLTPGGDCFPSKTFTISLSDVLNDEVIE